MSAVLERHKVWKVSEDKYIKKLPLNPAILPDHVRKHAEQCVAPQVRLSEILMLARQIPMRPRAKTKQLASGKEASNSFPLNALSQFLSVAQKLRDVQQVQPDNVNLQILQPQLKAPRALQNLLQRDTSQLSLQAASAPSSSAAAPCAPAARLVQMISNADSSMVNPNSQTATAHAASTVPAGYTTEKLQRVT